MSLVNERVLVSKLMQDGRRCDLSVVIMMRAVFSTT